MPVLNLGYTAPVNRPGQTPVLTLDQVWAGLQRKVRHAHEFVPVIVGCEVLEETKKKIMPQHQAQRHQPQPGDQHQEAQHDVVEEVLRRVTFAPGARSGLKGGGGSHGDTVRERCELRAPCRVDFRQEDGTTISNFVTRGSGDELFLTYVFEWRVDAGIDYDGDEEARAGYQGVSRHALPTSQLHTLGAYLCRGQV